MSEEELKVAAACKWRGSGGAIPAIDCDDDEGENCAVDRGVGERDAALTRCSHSGRSNSRGRRRLSQPLHSNTRYTHTALHSTCTALSSPPPSAPSSMLAPLSPHPCHAHYR